MPPESKSISRRRRWLLWAPVLLGVVVAGFWFFWPPEQPGRRMRIVWPGSAAALTAAGLQVELDEGLRAANVRAQFVRLSRDSEQTFIVLREECKGELLITAGAEPLSIADLRYTLLGPNGKEVGAGTLYPAGTLEAGAEGTFTIGDFGLERASTILLSR